MAFKEEGNCFAQELIFHRCVLTACCHQNQFPPTKIVLWASAHFVHQFPLLPWSSCLKILDCTTRDRGSLVREYWRKLKEGHLCCPRSPTPGQSTHGRDPATCNPEATVNSGHEWSFFPLLWPQFVVSLMLAWQPWGVCIRVHTPKREKYSIFSSPWRRKPSFRCQGNTSWTVGTWQPSWTHQREERQPKYLWVLV